MKIYDVITIGGATQDITFYTDEAVILDSLKSKFKQKMIAFKFGHKINIQEVHYTLGGGALNTAVTFSRMKLKTAALVSLGDDKEADDIKSQMKKEGIETSLIKIKKRHHTGFSFVLASSEQKEHTIFTYRGARKYLSISKDDLRNIRCKWVYITSLNQNKWKGDFKNILTGKKYSICWNPGNFQLQDGKAMSDFMKYTDVLYLNRSEACLLLSNISKKKCNNLTIRQMLKKIIEYGPKIIVITSGRKGADCYDGKEFIHQGIIPSNREDTTGVGDSFGSCLISGLAYGKDLKTSMKMGAMNSSSVVSKIGAQNGILNYSEITKKIKLVKN